MPFMFQSADPTTCPVHGVAQTAGNGAGAKGRVGEREGRVTEDFLGAGAQAATVPRRLRLPREVCAPLSLLHRVSCIIFFFF